MPTLIETRHLSYAYPVTGEPPRPALNDISVKIDAGEFVAIIGANGSGKSTLARHFNALLTPSTGSVLVNGLDTAQPANLPFVRAAVGMVFQQPQDQLVATSIEEDLAFGPENLNLPPAEVRARVEEALQALNLGDLRARPPHLLSAGQMQRVALAGVLAMRPRCIVFDESTAMLDPFTRARVLESMHHLHRQGVTVIMITHFMDEAAEAERVLLLDGGRLLLDAPAPEVFRQADLLQSVGLDLPPAAALANRLRRFIPSLPAGLYTTRDLLSALPPYPGMGHPAGNPTRQPGSSTVSTILQIRHVSHTYMAGTPLEQRSLEDVSWQVRSGEVHGLVGATGSGKSTLLQHANGLISPQSGSVTVGPYDLPSPALKRRDVCRFAGLVFQNPDYQLFEQFVGDEIAFAPRNYGQTENLRATVRRAMEIVGLDFETFKDRLTLTLSGGEKRKVALASVLAMQPQILLLDEPTAGLDPRSRASLLNALRDLQHQGMTVVLSTHQMDTLAETAETVSVLHRGRLVKTAQVAEVFRSQAELQPWGLDVPLACRLAGELRGKGWPLPDEAISPAALEDALARLVKGVSA